MTPFFSAGQIRSKIAPWFGIDVRSLAAFRICLAVVFFADLIVRASDLAAFYTDAGAFPRLAHLQTYQDPWMFSLNMAGGSLFFNALLFLAGFIAAVTLLLGYRPQLSSFIAWLILLSIHQRNPIVVGEGIFIRIWLFWAMFLPLGGAYSIDKALRDDDKNREGRIVSPASAAVLIQVFLIYFCSGLHKLPGLEWQNGTALFHALHYDPLTKPLGIFIRQFTGPLELLTRAVLAIEIAAPLLLFSPAFLFFFRPLGLILLLALNMGFIFFLELGPIPVSMTAGLIVFIPPEFWDKVLATISGPKEEKIVVHGDSLRPAGQKCLRIFKTFFLPQALEYAPDPGRGTPFKSSAASQFMIEHSGQTYAGYPAFVTLCRVSPILRYFTFILKWPPVVKAVEGICDKVCVSQSSSDVSFRAPKNGGGKSIFFSLTQFFAAIALFYVVYSNLISFDFKFTIPNEIHRVYASFLGLNQSWFMFAPRPPLSGGWNVIEGRLVDGRAVDLLRHGQPISWEKPPLIAATFKNQYWRKFWMLILYPGYEIPRQYYARYLCNQWNEKHFEDNRLKELEIFQMRTDILPDYKISEPRKISYGTYSC